MRSAPRPGGGGTSGSRRGAPPRGAARAAAAPAGGRGGCWWGGGGGPAPPGAAGARGGSATASSHTPGREPGLAVDDDGTTRWAVSKEERGRADSWWAVDLGAAKPVDRVTLRWEEAAGRRYRVQGSADGESWDDLVTGPAPAVSSTGGWLDVDGRAGLVVRGGTRPLAVYGDTIVLAADGAEEPLVVEGHCGVSPAQLRALASRPAPAAEDDRVGAALTDGYLSLFNLSAARVTTEVTLPRAAAHQPVYEGEQTTTADASAYTAHLDAASARVLPPRFTLAPLSPATLPPGLRIRVTDGANLHLAGPACRVRIEAQGHRTEATVRAGRETHVTLDGAAAYPHDDLALDRVTFPTSPLPSGMTSPESAVDGSRDTAWQPGRDGRMVVDLGARRTVEEVEAEWTAPGAPAAHVEFSRDGIRYQRAGTLTGKGRVRRLNHSGSPRYVALVVHGTPPEGAGVIRLSVR
ncbi:discoidin domain-containing protein [Streptomyces olivaceus]|uniref:discoidin domain-containing protein n=1 Tax=Streptomyces olivaceus TaxID=47716 RepID=UPI00364F7B1E